MLTTAIAGGVTAAAFSNQKVNVKSDDKVSVADFNTFVADKNSVDQSQTDRIAKVEDQLASSSVSSSVASSIAPAQTIVVQAPVTQAPVSSVASSVQVPFEKWEKKNIFDFYPQIQGDCLRTSVCTSWGQITDNYKTKTKYSTFAYFNHLVDGIPDSKSGVYGVVSFNDGVLVGDKFSIVEDPKLVYKTELTTYMYSLKAN